MEERTLSGRRILVTGGAKRIGRSICLRLAEAGAKVVVHYNRSEKDAEELVHYLLEVSSGHEKIKCDLTQPDERDHLIPHLIAGSQSLDGLVNNASSYRRSRIADCTPEEAMGDYMVNFFGPFHLMRHFANNCDAGVVINMLDQRVQLVDEQGGAYALAKRSLRDATEAAAKEWGPDIRVNGIAPGFVLPPPGVLAEKMESLLEQIPMRSRTTPEEIAEGVVFLMTNPTVTGEILYLDGGMHLGAPVAKEKTV